MLRYSHFSVFFLVFVIAIGTLVSLNLTFTLTWANDGDAGSEQASHTHGQENTVTLTDKAKANIGLRTVEVDVRAIEKIVHVHGNILAHPERQAIVTPRIGGIVKRIHFSVGEFIKKGDLLLELESLDLQMTQIEMIEAVAQKKSLESKLGRLTEVFAKQIRRELQTRQIDYLQSLSELQELQIAIEKRKVLAITKVISTLEQMRFRLVKADVELRLLRRRSNEPKHLQKNVFRRRRNLLPNSQDIGKD